MKTITIANRKGGAGKSTLAAHLSVLAQESGARVLLIDTDPQRSLAFWWRLREAGTPEMIECAADRLPKIILQAKADRVGLCLIDTPPHSDMSIIEAMRVATLVLVPTRPGPFDLAAVSATLELAERVRKTPLIVFNHAPASASWGEPAIVGEARAAVNAMGVKVAETVITQRVALSHAIIGGLVVSEYEPGGKAAREIAALWREIQPKLGIE